MISRAQVTVRRSHAVAAQDEERPGQGQAEDRQKQVCTGKEQGPGEYGKDQKENNGEVLYPVHNDSFLAEELHHIEKRLAERRAVPSLEPGTELSVEPGEESSQQGRQHDEGKHSFPDGQRSVHFMNRVHRAAAPNMMNTSVRLTKIPTLNRTFSPKYLSR
jgi:hypothetical protein